MFQIDDTFLQEVGLGALPAEQKQAFLAYFREQLELRVGTKLSEGLSDEQLAEFEAFMERDETRVDEWVARYAPEYASDTIYQQLKTSAPAGTPDLVVLAEYASLKWLGLNRPDYRDVVGAVMKELRDETAANKDAILATE